MINSRYAKAFKEVVEIIKHIPKEEYNRIPKEKIDFYKQNMDKEYQFTINPKIALAKQNISKEANAIIVMLYNNYFATETQKNKIKRVLEINEQKAEQERRRKFNPDNIFGNRKKSNKK